MAPPRTPTVLPNRACAAADDPACTTTPPPSLPTGKDSSILPPIARSMTSGIFAVITGRSAVPPATAVDMSAPPNNSPRSEGLIGEASTRTTTSFSPGAATGTDSRDSCSSPLDFTKERSCRPVAGTCTVIRSISISCSLSFIRQNTLPRHYLIGLSERVSLTTTWLRP